VLSGCCTLGKVKAVNYAGFYGVGYGILLMNGALTSHSSCKGGNHFCIVICPIGKGLADIMQDNCKSLLMYTLEQKLADLTFLYIKAVLYTCSISCTKACSVCSILTLYF
jgi:hypothetical protein